jgi:hypothetical protein
VGGGDGGLEPVLSEGLAAGRALEGEQAGSNERCVPARTILVGQREEVAALVQARGQARGMQAHQRGQRACLGGVGGGMLA